MTTPTPAGWYSDPEQAGQLRYWDGGAWTEHRSPVQGPSAPATSEPPSTQELSATTDSSAAEHAGAHRAPDAERQPADGQLPTEQPTTEQQTTEQPTTEVPLREWSFEPPPLEPDATPEPFSTFEPTHEPPPVPLTEQPTTKVPLGDWSAEPASEPTPGPSSEPPPYADATTSTPPEPAAVEPPAGTEPREPVDNRKLVMGFGGAVAGLLVLLVLAAVYAFVIHKPDTARGSSPGNETSTRTTQATATSPGGTSTAAQAQPPGAGATDGPLTFTVTGVDRGSTVSDPTNEFLTKDAQGQFIVVHLTVQNTSPDPGQFLGTFQKLKAAGQVYSIDDQATFYVGGGFVDIPAGGQVDVGLAYDVPPGTTPETIELHADPTSAGVELPVQ